MYTNVFVKGNYVFVLIERDPAGNEVAVAQKQAAFEHCTDQGDMVRVLLEDLEALEQRIVYQSEVRVAQVFSDELDRVGQEEFRKLNHVVRMVLRPHLEALALL